MNGEGKDNTMETKTVSQGLLLPNSPAAGAGDASPTAGAGGAPPGPLPNGNGLAPDNTERPARKPGEGRKYFSFSQYTKYAQICQEMYRALNRFALPEDIPDYGIRIFRDDDLIRLPAVSKAEDWDWNFLPLATDLNCHELCLQRYASSGDRFVPQVDQVNIIRDREGLR